MTVQTNVKMHQIGAVPVNRAAPRRKRPSRFRSNIGAVIALLVLLAVWTFVASRTVSYILPSPWSIATELVKEPMLFLQEGAVTAVEAFLGLILGTVLAIIASVIFLFSTSLRRSLFPLAVGLNSVPLVALAPLFIIALGQGLPTKVVITTLISYFPTLIAMTKGLTSVEPEAVEYFQTLRVGPLRTLWLLRWPASLPQLFVALKIAASSCVISAVIAEWVSAQHGLGYLIISSSREFNILTMWAAVVSATFLALIGFAVVLIVERVVLRNRPEAKQ